MSRVFFDSNIFIYLFEDYGEVSERAAHLRQRMLERGDQLVTSALTLGEVMVMPIRKGAIELANRYESAISSAAQIVNFDAKAARLYAGIRSDSARNVRPADAIQVACAAAAQVDLFITNDEKLHQLHVPGIQFFTSVERAPL